MKNTLIILLSLLLFTTCSQDDDIYALPIWSPTENGYVLAWGDDFDGNKIDRTKWDYRAVGKIREKAIVDSSTIYLDGKGHLIIELCERDGKFYVGQLTTQYKQMFKYGYFECNVFLNQQAGMHSAFWLQSPKVAMGEDPATYGAEIDIFEYVAIESKRIYNTVWWDYNNIKSIRKTTSVANIKNGFHTFGLEWTSDEYVFYIDNREVWRTSTAVSQIEEYIILSTEYTGWGGSANPKKLPDKIVFDYVKVYSKK
ncbi:MAG: family 16 glycosylhydrolase [Dysgonomonas sp.]